MITSFKDDDFGFERWLKDNPCGYVYNDFGGANPVYKVLHRSDCRTLQVRTTYRKICSANLHELLDWLNEHRGREGIGYHLCSWCHPLESCTADIHQRADSTQRARQTLESPEPVSDTVAFVLARRLIQIYTQHKLPRYAETFYNPLGYTKQEMEGKPDKLYSLIVLAAYDRQPFTRVAQGWESIWGTRSETDSIRALLSTLGLLEMEAACYLSLDRIQSLLREKRFRNFRIDTDGAHTDYAKTIKDAARVVKDSQLLGLMMHARIDQDVEHIFKLLDDIHGIGETIASKIVMYTLREIEIGQVGPSHLYPAVEPILSEYHNARLVSELEQKFGASIMAAIYKCLKKLGDPFAVDALYYIDREEPELRKLLFQPE